MTESRQQYIERMAAIAAKKNWSSGDFEWLNNHLGKNDLVVEIEKSAQHHAHLTPESLAPSQAVFNASALEQSDGDTRPAQAQVA